MSVKICCDFCERPLPINTLERENRDAVYYEKRWTKELDTRRLFRTLCPSCASKIDQVVVFAKDRWLKQIDISDRNTRLNAARRELLGTKG